MAASPSENIPLKYQGLLNRLKDLQCHFTWNIHYVAPETTWESHIKVSIQKEEAPFAFESGSWKYVRKFFLAYLYYEAGNVADSEGKLDEVNFDDLSYLQGNRKKGLEYVREAFQSFINFKKNLWVETEMILDKLNYEDLPAEGQAAVLALRASSLAAAGIKGNEAGLPYIREAIKLDPHHAEWHFLMGKALMKIRHLEHPYGCPTDKEICHLENANALEQSPLHLVFLGQCMSDKAKYLHRMLQLGMTPTVRIAYNRALDCFYKALRINSDCPGINIRCADGFMMMPRPFKNFGLAKVCIQRALELAPDNSMVLQKAGTYYEIMQDWNRAKTYYEKSIESAYGKGNFPASLKLVNAMSTLDPSFDPFPMIQDMMSKYTESKNRIVTQLVFRGLFHYARRGNMESAAIDFHEAIITSRDDVEPNFMRLCGYACFWNSLNLGDLLKDLHSLLRAMEISPEKEVQDQGARLKLHFMPVVKVALQRNICC